MVRGGGFMVRGGGFMAVCTARVRGEEYTSPAWRKSEISASVWSVDCGLKAATRHLEIAFASAAGKQIVAFGAALLAFLIPFAAGTGNVRSGTDSWLGWGLRA
eukprot:CAMPEP_0198230250 /NCGR_PEP_ID=MMETSP1445-20131203/114565_1 /TAXON_ID=36898 /ORGANISM="Pyramimonas sp., Strain CCMP2087" /LENGTH=102 /DNA_ID=CAMNT_0043910779 /DNA_START=883 /DNA_END=1192 /DNA_ORIENTATION=-